FIARLHRSETDVVSTDCVSDDSTPAAQRARKPPPIAHSYYVEGGVIRVSRAAFCMYAKIAHMQIRFLRTVCTLCSSLAEPLAEPLVGSFDGYLFDDCDKLCHESRNAQIALSRRQSLRVVELAQ